MAQMTIGQLAARAGIRPSAVRYYESVRLLPVAARVRGQRRYGPETLQWLAGIRIAQRAGLTVAEIRHLFHGFPRSTRPSERWQELARKKLPEIEELIRRAQDMKRLLLEGIRCRCGSLRECSIVGAELPGQDLRG